ncbi:MAG TPA: hypothetical protein VI756_13675 [Blastocatellia bacterium]
MSATGGDGARISGIVTIDGKPASGVLLFAYAVQTHQGSIFVNSVTDQTTGRATTDSEGHYAFNNLSAGSYIINPFAPVLARPQAAMAAQSKTVSVEAGESVEGIDFSRSRGGIITGRVTRADGRPAVEISVRVSAVDESAKPGYMTMGTFTFPTETDDRGIYRIYGLNPGGYTVCAQPHENASSPYLENVFYSGSDKSALATITLSAGEEIGNIDITLGARQASYQATGQAVDDAGKPVAGAIYYHYKLSDDGTPLGGAFRSVDQTDQNGRFRLEGLVNGRYQVMVVFDAQSGEYSDPAQFEIKDQNVSGIQIRAHTGASVSGFAVLEGNQDPEVLSQVSEVNLQLASAVENSLYLFQHRSVTLASDGSFQASGFTPGTINIFLEEWNSPPGFSLLRIERDGIPQPDGITVSAGEQVTGLRIVLGYGTGVLRGQVTVQGGMLPVGTNVSVSAQLILGGQAGPLSSALIDARGRFEIDGLCDGQYQLAIGWNGSSQGIQQNQIITVSGGQTSDVSLVLDLGRGK